MSVEVPAIVGHSVPSTVGIHDQAVRLVTMNHKHPHRPTLTKIPTLCWHYQAKEQKNNPLEGLTSLGLVWGWTSPVVDGPTMQGSRVASQNVLA